VRQNKKEKENMKMKRYVNKMFHVKLKKENQFFLKKVELVEKLKKYV